MIIGFDAKRAVSNFTGLGNYSRSTIARLLKHAPEHQYRLYTPKVGDTAQLDFLPTETENILYTPESLMARKMGSLWRSFGLSSRLQSDKVDLYHGLSHELPFGIGKSGIKSVVTVHDLIYLRYPEYFGSIDRKIYDAKCRYACKTADAIIAISTQTKEDLIKLLGVEAEKIHVVFQTCDDAFLQRCTEEFLQETQKLFRLPQQYLLHVGTVEPRKNIITAIKALALLPAEIPLVVVGRHTPYTNEAMALSQELGVNNRILWLPKVPFSHLTAIYQLAKLFVYPSIFEGFGIPLVEAMHSGIPIVCSSGSCFEETAGSQSSFFTSNNEHEMAEAIEKLWFNDALRHEMVEAGYDYVKKFDGFANTQALLKIYESI